MTVALVTGGGGGIGQATARLLAERGAQVVVADIDGDAATATAAAIGADAAAFRVDDADGASVEALVAFTT